MKSEVNITGKRLQITRVFQAPRPLVFSWWKQAEKLQQWSGCKDATKCEIEMDFRVGGSFTQKMQIAGAGEFTITGTYDEIVQPERITYRADLGRAVTRVTVEFFEHGAGTKVVLTHDGFPDENFCKPVAKGTSESFEKLDALLAAQVPMHAQ
jgi:uncharacterized protein YndB with AHSA1/START domain